MIENLHSQTNVTDHGIAYQGAQAHSDFMNRAANA